MCIMHAFCPQSPNSAKRQSPEVQARTPSRTDLLPLHSPLLLLRPPPLLLLLPSSLQLLQPPLLLLFPPPLLTFLLPSGFPLSPLLLQKSRWHVISRVPGHSAQDGVLSAYREMRERELGDSHRQQTARPRCPGQRAVHLQRDARAGAGGPRLHQPTISTPSRAHTHQHPHNHRSELGFILISVIPCSSLNHSNAGMTNSVPLSITDRVTQGS